VSAESRRIADAVAAAGEDDAAVMCAVEQARKQ
jgi:hypothetical protein